MKEKIRLNLHVQCSNCGHRSRNFKIDHYGFSYAPEKIVEAGWNSFGCAFYCPKCVKTWETRNGKDRPLWGAGHTRERVYQVMVGDLLNVIEYYEKGEWPM